MAEKLINGTFTSNLNGWSNIGTRQFVYASPGLARGTSTGTLERYFCLRQSFVKYGEVLTATISSDVFFYSVNGDDPGTNRFVIELDRPSGGSVVLYDSEFTNEIGSDTALVNENIAAHLTSNGTYYLRLGLYSQAAVTGGVVVEDSYGEYDNVSILVTEKFTASATETLGGGEVAQKKQSVIKSVIIGLIESLSSIGGGDDMAAVEGIGLIEIIGRVVKKAVSEVAGLVESLVRTYGYCHHDIPDESVGLVESMSAKVVAGNVTRVVTGFAPVTEWSEIAPAETDWEQTR